MTKKGDTVSASLALYRKYRPRSLAHVVSQPQTTEVLKRSLKQGKIAHAYLLTGPKGVGKTSIARILAHEINNLPYNDETNLDIIEIDAASNNSVEDVRDLRERVQIAPVSASKKVYIIDEVHMLSKSAFNALLKTLEEPPAHVVFILATTDLHKVPATIISRTQHFAFHAISQRDLAAQLGKIAKAEGIQITDEALEAIASRGDGSFRNSISLLDQLSGFADDKQGITLDLVQSTLGLAPSDAVDSLLAAVSRGDVPSVISQLDELESAGIQPVILADQLVRGLRASLAENPANTKLIDNLINISTSSQPQLRLLSMMVGAAAENSNYDRPSSKIIATPATKPQPSVIEAPIVIIEKPKPVATKKIENDNPKPIVSKTQNPSRNPKLDWSKLLEHTKEKFVPLYSMLVKCEHDYADGALTIYAGRKFSKSKLDEPKYHSQLLQALEHIGCEGIAVTTLANTKPPADEKLARIADMMGGGKEVKLEEGE